MAELVIFPALYMGLLIGLYELFLVHKDENFRGSHWMGHGLHAVGWAMAAVFAVMNVEYIYTLFPKLGSGIPWLENPITFRLAIGLIMMIKIHSAAAVIKATGGGKAIGETWGHSFVVAILIVISPYVWPFIEPSVGKILPVK